MEKDYFSNWTDNIRIFGPEIEENEIQNCKSLEKKLKTVFLWFLQLWINQ